MTRSKLIRIVLEQAIFSILVALIVALFVYFPIMLALGALHSEWPAIPAFGWGSTYIIVTSGILALDLTSGHRYKVGDQQ